MTSYKEWKRSLAKLSEEQMIPLTVECELTSKCNFSCEMCYVKDNQSKDALSLEEWYQLFDEAIEAGALFFVLTGGEPLSHPNFWKIYRYLADKGVKITVFTNGSFLDELAVSRFTKNPPEMIVISLYGHNQETVSKFTKVSNAFALVDKGIDLLRNANIPFILRTLPVVSIYNQLPELIEYVRSKNQFLGYQLYLAPGKNQKNPHSLRLNPVQLYNFEQLLLKSFSQYQLEDCQSSMTSSNCQALRTGCYITHEGDIRPCSMALYPSEKYRIGHFLTSYRSLASKWKQYTNDLQCQGCEHVNHCLKCPVRLNYEKGCSLYLQDIARQRGGDNHGDL